MFAYRSWLSRTRPRFLNGASAWSNRSNGAQAVESVLTSCRSQRATELRDRRGVAVAVVVGEVLRSCREQVGPVDRLDHPARLQGNCAEVGHSNDELADDRDRPRAEVAGDREHRRVDLVLRPGNRCARVRVYELSGEIVA